jgi:hypothetical protein
LESALEVAQQRGGDWEQRVSRPEVPLESYFLTPTGWPSTHRSTAAAE